MSHLGEENSLVAAKLLGSAAGAWVSLIYLLPKSLQEAATRFLTGLTCGLIFGGPTGLWLTDRLGLEGQLSSLETALGGSAAASLSAWWALGALSRIADRYGAKTGSR
ncbi:DUF6107 family protein [Rhizobium oryzicola]|uniref:DUF6107 family protein n=1 Tax=Rhizobium oryzicola TaxID=1232668 RepID=A0ABT8ST04_9HYPH|nr:DUF6107 family protein [Rhizobium oryzicola]MDO1581552.1 DUF6107 family protein [Rhizobium oryzicola]